MYVLGPLSYPLAGMTSLMSHTVIGRRLFCWKNISIRQSNIWGGSADSSVPQQVAGTSRGGVHSVGCWWHWELFVGSMLGEVCRQPGTGRRRPDLHNRTPASSISLFPPCESPADCLAEMPGARLPNALSCSCGRETHQAGEAEPIFRGELSFFLTTVAET